MQILLTLDKKDYEEGMPVFEKYSTRGVIIRDGKIATQHGSAGDYKILGGGVEPGEKLEDALIREVGGGIRAYCDPGIHPSDWRNCGAAARSV